MMIKKNILAWCLAILLMPTIAFASIDKNLYFGMTGNSQVKELQQYLISKGLLTGQATGNFFSLTLGAVKKFQQTHSINTTGLVGPLTRQAINSDSLVKSNASATTTTTTPLPMQTGPVVPFSGSLDIIQTVSYTNQSVTAPKTAIKLAGFSLTNNTNEPINLTTLEADLSVGSDIYTSNLYIANLYATYGVNMTTVSGNVGHINSWTMSNQLASGKSLEISIYGDVNSFIPLNSVITASILVNGVSALSKTTVASNQNVALAGQSITFGSSSLTVSQDSKTPPSTMAVVNQRVTAGIFQITSTGDSYTVTNLTFVIPFKNAGSVISDVLISNTDTKASVIQKPIPVFYDTSNNVVNAVVSIPVALNTSVSLTVSYDLAQTIDSNNANNNLAPILTYIKAKNSSGGLLDGTALNYPNVLSASNAITLPDNGIVANPLYLFKNLPVFTPVVTDGSLVNNANNTLYSFSITAGSGGNISIKQLSFMVTIADPNSTNPSATNFTLFKGSVNDTGSVAIGTMANNNFIGLTGINGVGTGSTTITVTFPQEEVIPAGKTQTYSLKAELNRFGTTSLGADSIAVYLPQDTDQLVGTGRLHSILNDIYYQLTQDPTNISSTAYNVLWSDWSSSFPNPHNYLNGIYTNDWYNGFGIKALPLSIQTLTAK